jgi:hypothetical protein
MSSDWFLDWEDDIEVYRCFTCGSDECSMCCRPHAPGKFLHITWHEDVCEQCQGPPLTEEELDEVFG